MSDTTNTTSPAVAPADSTAASSPQEAVPSPQSPEAATVASGDSQAAFDMATWKASGSNRSELPEAMRGLYDQLSDDFSKRDSFNAVKELRGLIDKADSGQRQGVYDNQPRQSEPDDVEKQVQVRLAQARNQEAVSKFRGNFETMLKEPISVGDGHTFAFADKNELTKFVEYSRDVLNNGSITPQDLYKLWNFDRILADTGEWKARKHEETLRKAATGPRSNEQGGTQATSKKEASGAGEQRGNQTVEEIMQEKFPEIYGNMKSGNVRYG